MLAPFFPPFLPLFVAAFLPSSAPHPFSHAPFPMFSSASVNFSSFSSPLLSSRRASHSPEKQPPPHPVNSKSLTSANCRGYRHPAGQGMSPSFTGKHN